MVSGFIRSQRITTFVAIGGISIAVALYILFRKKSNKKEVTPPPPSSSSPATSSADQETMSRTSKTSIRENNILPNVSSTTTTTAAAENVDEIKGKNKENAPLPEIITEMNSPDSEIIIKLADEQASPNENENSSPVIEKEFEKLEVSKNGAETIERELSPIEKILAENTPLLDWAECSFQDMESETERNGNCGQTCTDSSSTHSNEEKMTETTVVTNELATTVNGRDYKMADSPSVDSTHSEVSNDSGRATGMNPSALTPYDFDMNVLPMYEFEVPNTLVGLIIGVRGKTIRELCTRADVRILIRPHHDQSKLNTHQICSIEGKRDDINKCLHMMRHRFPPNRFPDLNLKPVFPPPIQPPVLPSSDLMQLSLPAGVTSEVYVSAPVDAGHFFVQMPTHPTFPSLISLDTSLNNLYYQSFGVQDTLKPNKINIMCAAPAANGWYRALTLCYDEKQDEMLVRFVDYGGYARMARTDLRYLLRQDLLTLPYQSIECYLADVEPIDGTTWSHEANEYFKKMCTQKIIQAELIGHNRFDGLPYVRLLIKNKRNENVRFDTLLLKRGYAKSWDSSRCVPLPLPKITVTNEDAADEANTTTNNVEATNNTEEKKSKGNSRSNSKNKKSKGPRSSPVAQTA